MAAVIESVRTPSLHVIKGVCHALGSSPTFADAIEAVVAWTHAAVGEGSSSARLFLMHDGELRLVADNTQGGLKVSRRSAPRLRRLALSSREPQVDAHQPDRRETYVAFPLMCRGKAVGVLEVGGDSGAISERWDALEAVVSQAAIVFQRLEEIDDLRRRLRSQQHADELLDTGIQWTAHEIRRPLLAVTTVLEQVMNRLDESTEDLDLIDRSRLELRTLAEQIQQILQWPTRAESLQREYVDVEETVREAIETCDGPARDRVAVFSSGSARVLADAEQLRVALSNILRNALQYSPEQNPVFVSVRADERRVLLTVRDRGPGVPREEQAAIFEPNVRGRAAGQFRSGSGLGLSIAKHLIEAQGGSVWLDSDRRGTAFHIELGLN